MSTVNVRYMVDDVEAAVAFYTGHLGFTLLTSAAPAFADVTRGDLRLLLSGPASSAGRPMPDGTKPVPGGWNRIEFVVDDIVAEVDRLRGAGLRFRNDIVTGPGGSQILFDDLELQIRYFMTSITDDRRALAEAIAPGFGLEPDVALESGVALVGTVDECCDLLAQRREEWGVSYVVVGDDQYESFAPVVARLAGT